MKRKADPIRSLLKIAPWLPQTRKAILMPCQGRPGPPRSGPTFSSDITVLPFPQAHQGPACLLFPKDSQQLVPTSGPSHSLSHPPGTLIPQLPTPRHHHFGEKTHVPISAQMSHPSRVHPIQSSLPSGLPAVTHYTALLPPFHFSLLEWFYFFILILSVSSKHTKP